MGAYLPPSNSKQNQLSALQLTQFWHYLLGGSVKSQRLRAQFNKIASDSSHPISHVNSNLGHHLSF